MASINYPFIEIEKLLSVLNIFNYYSGLEVCLLDSKAEIIRVIGVRTHINTRLEESLPDPEVFKAQRMEGLLECARIGKIHSYSCADKLNYMVYPITVTNEISGGILAGPYYALDEISHSSNDLISEIPVLDAVNIKNSQLLLYHLMGDIISGYKDLMLFKQKSIMHKTRINKALENYDFGGMKESKRFPFDEETALLAALKSGNLDNSIDAFNKYIIVLRDFTNNDLSLFREYAIELCGIMSRFIIQKGADHRRLLHMTEKLVRKAAEADNIDDMIYIISDNLEIFSSALYHSIDKTNTIVKRVSEYIAEHYPENISLTSAAEFVNLNPSYLSRIFNKVTKMSFKDYVNKVRIDESQRLLTYSDHSILDIAVACGFNDQSYYSRIFKKLTGVTPRQFRDQSIK